MDVYAPGWLRDVDNIRVLITQIGFVHAAVRVPRHLVRSVTGHAYEYRRPPAAPDARK